jgi:parallel beta-helix repeat protein
MFKKYITIGVILIFLFSITTPTIFGYNKYKNNTIYVNNDNISGPWHGTKEHPYQYIQDAIESASNGNTVFVYKGTYFENIIINKSISLFGDNNESTIIDGNNKYDVIQINSENVTINDFIIKNSGCSGRDAGIEINADNIIISNNTIFNNTIGIFLYESNNNELIANHIINNTDYGIHLYLSHENKISNNMIKNNRWGLLLTTSFFNQIYTNDISYNKIHGLWLSRSSNYNNISKNSISYNNEYGVYLNLYTTNNTILNNIISSNNKVGITIGFYWPCNGNIVSDNIISLNEEYGICIYDSSYTYISENNFIDNQFQAFFNNCYSNTWKNNYWGKSLKKPYFIWGENNNIPWFNIDWKPVSEPHDIFLIIKPNEKPYDKDLIKSSHTYDLPSSFFWYDINGTDFTSSVKNQIPAPTCETYALCTAIETIVHNKIGYPFGCDLSEAHLFFYSGGTCDWGVDVTEPAEYLVKFGVPDEGCFPDPHRPFDSPFESLTGWENRTVKIKEWGWVDNNIEAIKNALINHGPLVICQLTRKDLDQYQGGVYMPKINSPIKRGHVVTIIGYDDTYQCWIIRNSGGEKWGENGNFRISYNAFDPFYSFIFPFYGGSGILYIDGVYGNLIHDFPKVQIVTPRLYKTYINGVEIPTVFKNIPSIQRSAPRIFGNLIVSVEVDNGNIVKFFLDGKMQHIDDSPPFDWILDTDPGLHTIEIYCLKSMNISKAIIDVFIIK